MSVLCPTVDSFTCLKPGVQLQAMRGGAGAPVRRRGWGSSGDLACPGHGLLRVLRHEDGKTALLTRHTASMPKVARCAVFPSSCLRTRSKPCPGQARSPELPHPGAPAKSPAPRSPGHTTGGGRSRIHVRKPAAASVNARTYVPMVYAQCFWDCAKSYLLFAACRSTAHEA